MEEITKEKTKEEKENHEGKLGLIQVFTGNGKGKSTAAIGTGFRAAGHGFKVLMIQFMKGGKHTGELESAKNSPNFEIVQFGKPCTYSELLKSGKMVCGNCRDCFLTMEEEKEKAEEAFLFAEKSAKSGDYDLIILDEINIALSKKLIQTERVLNLFEQKNRETELILTGRNAPSEIIAAADLVTEMVEVKHPSVKGIFARRGIEY